MDLDRAFKDIKKLYYTLHSKDADVLLTYKGTSHGITKPYQLTCDANIVNAVSHEEAFHQMLTSLKQALAKKIIDNKEKNAELEKVLNSFSN